jgi:hypothetical protein
LDPTSNYVNPVFASGPIHGAWSHLVMSIARSPNVATSYLNGAQAGQVSFNLMSFDATAELDIGGVAGFFQGSIDEVRIYSHTLTAPWVQTEYDNLAKPGFVTVGRNSLLSASS